MASTTTRAAALTAHTGRPSPPGFPPQRPATEGHVSGTASARSHNRGSSEEGVKSSGRGGTEGTRLGGQQTRSASRPGCGWMSVGFVILLSCVFKFHGLFPLPVDTLQFIKRFTGLRRPPSLLPSNVNGQTICLSIGRVSAPKPPADPPPRPAPPGPPVGPRPAPTTPGVFCAPQVDVFSQHAPVPSVGGLGGLDSVSSVTPLPVGHLK